MMDGCAFRQGTDEGHSLAISIHDMAEERHVAVIVRKLERHLSLLLHYYCTPTPPHYYAPTDLALTSNENLNSGFRVA
jgi:hypothetical protein